MTEVVLTLLNRQDLPKFMPGKASCSRGYQTTETEDVLWSIIDEVQTSTGLSSATRHDLYKLNSYLISKKGLQLQSRIYTYV